MTEKFENYIYINKMYLTLLGIWPLHDKASYLRLTIHKFHPVTIIMSIAIFLVIPMLFDLYMVWGDFNAVVQNLCLTVHSVNTLIKFSHIVTKKKLIKNMVLTMQHNWDISVSSNMSEDEKNILFYYARFALYITKGFIVSVYFFLILMYCLPFIYGIDSDPARNKRYPFCCFYYWDEKSNVIYAIAYFTQVFLGLIMGISFPLGMDSFCCTAIYHTCAQLSILQTQLLKVGTESNISKIVVKNLVLKHKFQVSKLCLIQLLTSCITVCFIGFQFIIIVSSSHVDLNGAFFYAGFLLANLFQVLLYCWPSDELMDQSYQIGMSAYQSLWTNLIPTNAKLLSLLILRAQKRLVLSAGGLYDMNLQNFTGELLWTMENNFNRCLLTSTLNKQKIILLDHANFARTVTRYFLLSVYYFETLLFLVPFIYGIDTDPVRHKRYPYCSWYYYDQYSNVVYALCYGIQAFIGICLGVSFLAGMDSFIFVAIWHSCAQLSILQMKLLKLGDASLLTSETIEDIVHSHNSQIRLVLILNQLFSKLCLYQLMTSGFVICFSGFQLIVSLNSEDSDYRGTVLYSGYLVVNLFQILLYCWPSNELMEKSFGVGHAAYQSLWTNLRHNSSKAVILMILRAQNPLIISAGGMYDMTLQNFTRIVKASMSFLSLLRAMMTSH
ncbi:uncharacterized protein LOC127278655 isoform X2 [Leptopilina boulardi]|uniref:uncharacterized protein LOC127278655 isoform X2 n=1 Tax=Leptopilina boulardi TaxID=63433 RepID=UPI0021F60383|nr:uncharacterized protein LOC127278655 isoform X2 [Leptopilina boulardi]